MCNKLETLYKKLTGLNPRKDLEPPLAGQALMAELKRLRGKGTGIFSFDPAQIQEVKVYDCGLISDGPFTVLLATLTNDATVGCYLFEAPPEREKLTEYAINIPVDQWFSFTPDRPSESGV